MADWINSANCAIDRDEVIASRKKRADFEGEETTFVTVYLRGGSEINLSGNDAESLWAKLNADSPSGEYRVGG